MQDNNKQNNSKKIITIPNILSFFRLCLIPVIVWLYVGKKDYRLTLLTLILSGVTDIVDGFIARKFNMVSDFGKALDPVADKLTQIAMLLCLVSRFWYMLIPLILLIVKEITTAVTAIISIKRTGEVKSAVWHGKLTTVLLYTMMVIHVVWYNIPSKLSVLMVTVCLCVMLMSFVMYVIQYVKAIINKSYNN